MKQFFKHPMRLPGMLIVPLMFLAAGAKAQLPETYGAAWTNTGYVSHQAGTGSNAFSVITGGSYDNTTYGTGTDAFVGPLGITGAQEIAGTVAPLLGNLSFDNGTISQLNITNTAGLQITNNLTFNNGITSTVRTNRTSGLAGAIQFLSNGNYTPALTPAIGVDARFTDGFVSKVNPAAFVYPVGNVTDLRPITATGTGTFATAWSNTNAATPYPYTTATLPIGTSALNTNGYWEWSGTAAATATLSIPDETAFTTANKLSVMAYNGTAWTNLGGVFTANTENSTNTAVVAIPATTQALALGQTVPYVQVSPAAFLMGAMSGTSMTKNLNTLGRLPLAQPYTSGTKIYSGTELLAALPINMVDWVLVDIRDSITPTTIVATKAAILMTDGTITDVNGVDPVTFLNVTPGNYYVGLRHRNHLSVRSAVKLALSSTTTAADFRTSMSSVYTNTALVNAPMKDMGNSTFAMWAGDANGDGLVRYAGSNNDRGYILFTLLASNTNNTVSVFSNGDLNLDGVVRYGGSNNDRGYILFSLLGSNGNLVLREHL